MRKYKISFNPWPFLPHLSFQKAFIIKGLFGEILHISNMKVIFISTETAPSFLGSFTMRFLYTVCTDPILMNMSF